MSKYRDRKTRSFKASLSQHKGDRASAQRCRLCHIAGALRLVADYPHSNYPEPTKGITWETPKQIGGLDAVRKIEIDRDTLIDLRFLVDALTEIANGGDANRALGVSRSKGERPQDYQRDRRITWDVINEHTSLGHLEDNNREPGAFSVVAEKHGLSSNRVRQIYEANKGIEYERRLWTLAADFGRWLNQRGLHPEMLREYGDDGQLVGITLIWRDRDGTEHVTPLSLPKSR